jgi:hypothetical protein
MEVPESRQEIIALAQVARRLRRRPFAKAHPGLFLLARPDEDGDFDDADEMAFDTVAVSVDDFVDQGLNEWLALPLIWPADASPGHRLSIGRAPGCDMVIRMPFVSKMHAYIQLGPDDALAVGDHRSANGTRHNGRALGPNDRAPLVLGDWVQLGLLPLQLVDASRLHEALNSAAFTAWEADVR